MAFSCQQQMRAPVAPARGRSATCRVVASAAVPKSNAVKASLAAAGAALLLGAAPTPAMAVQPLLDPVATVAVEESAAGPSDSGPFTKLLDSIPNIFSPLKKIDEDPFGADRAQAKTVGDTKKPIPIPTEQEAVAPEAFPNPSELRSPRPPVLAAAEGDENLGANAGQFKDLDASGRQELIDKQSPAERSTN